LTSARPPRPESKAASKSRPSSGKSKLHHQLSLPNFSGADNNQPSSINIGSQGGTVSGSVAPTLQLTSNVYVESPLAILPEESPKKVLRSHSVRGVFTSPEPEIGLRPSSHSSVTSGGNCSATNAMG